jgi:hypothetical protein
MTARAFHLGDVLSVTTGLLVSPRRVEALYDVLDPFVELRMMRPDMPVVGVALPPEDGAL